MAKKLNKLHLITWVVLVLVFLMPRYAAAQHMNAKDSPCNPSATTADLYACLNHALSRQDAALNKYYQRVQTVVEQDELAKLKEAQRLWIQFRDANCDAEYMLYDGGSAAPSVREACLEAMTRHRVEELKTMYGWRLEKFGK